MKTKLHRFAVPLLVALAALSASGQVPYPQLGFGGPGVGPRGTNDWFISSALSGRNPGGNAVVAYVNTTSDLSSSKLSFYPTLAGTQVTFTNSTTTIYVAATNGFTGTIGQPIIIRHVAADVYERAAIATVGNGTNITVQNAPSYTVTPGDIVYPTGTAATVAVGATSLTLTGVTGVWQGQNDQYGNPLPVLIQVNGTSACSLNAVSGFYSTPSFP